MNNFYKSLCVLVCAFFFSASYAQKNNTEVLTVTHYDGLSESLSPSVASKIANSRMDAGNYHSYYANNNGSPSMRNQKQITDYSGLSTSLFENKYSTNTSSLPGPATNNSTYELLTGLNSKERFSEIAFLDSTTAVTISYLKNNAYLLLVDVISNPMKVISRVSVPISGCCKHPAAIKELFYIDAAHRIILPVNKGSETVSDGQLAWKKSKHTTPGLWIITPVKNEDKKWMLDRSQIAVNYFSNDALLKGKHELRIQTAHSDNNGNIWMSFTHGLMGVMPLYAKEVALYNFNRDIALYIEMQKNYKEELYADLKGSVEDQKDTVALKKSIYDHPGSFSQQYLEDARYRLLANLEKEKNVQLDSNSYYENPEELMKYIHVNLDNPMDKKKTKLKDYSGSKIHQFQTIHNGITSGNDNSVYVVTNLALYQLSYNEKSNNINVNWFTPYKNSFIKTGLQKKASSGTTPTFIAERNEVVICDNDFPHANMLIIDAASGNIKQKFSLFEYSYGGACENSVAYIDHTIIVGNTFGNGNELKDKDDIPASGVMKFTSVGSGNWRADYDWNKLHYTTTANTAIPKISSPDERIYIYHQPDEKKEWQISSLSLKKADQFNPVLYSLQPDYKGVVKVDLNNFRSTFTIGPKKSIFIGTTGGLLKVMSE